MSSDLLPDLNKLSPPSTPPNYISPEERAQNARTVSEYLNQNTQLVSGKRKYTTDIKIAEPKPEYGTEAYYEREVQKAQQAVVRKELQVVARNQLYANPQMMLPDYKCLQPLKLHVEQMNGVNTASSFVYIVVSPDPRDHSQNPHELLRLADKAVHKVWIGEWLLTFEQRGVIDTPEFGKGVHLNFIIKKHPNYMKKAPTDMAREFRNTFKHVIGTNCFSAVDYRYATDPTNFLTYLAGQKDESHNPEVIMSDDVWRRDNKLQSFYSSNGWGAYIQELNEYARIFYSAPFLLEDEEETTTTEEESIEEVPEAAASTKIDLPATWLIQPKPY